MHPIRRSIVALVHNIFVALLVILHRSLNRLQDRIQTVRASLSAPRPQTLPSFTSQIVWDPDHKTRKTCLWLPLCASRDLEAHPKSHLGTHPGRARKPQSQIDAHWAEVLYASHMRCTVRLDMRSADYRRILKTLSSHKSLLVRHRGRGGYGAPGAAVSITCCTHYRESDRREH